MVHSFVCSSFVKSASIQMAVSLVANLCMLNTGLVLGFPSAVLPPLQGDGPGLHVSANEASWVAGLAFLSAPVACLLAGPLVDWVGRRWGLLLVNLLFTAGWLLMAVFSHSLLAMYAGRLLTGAGLGMATCASVTYTVEIASLSLRTILVTFCPVMMGIGTFLAYLGAMLYQVMVDNKVSS